jgi:hypothetical protein
MCRTKRQRSRVVWVHKYTFLSFCAYILFSAWSFGALGPEDVLILVNQNSPASRYIAKLYRQYYPDITDEQVLYLSGLTDCSSKTAVPADEIITRDQYEQLIAEPVRAYLSDSNYPDRISQIKVIITTAGMPYRIADTSDNVDNLYDTGNVVYAAGSNPTVVSGTTQDVNAASVESELAGLWYGNYGNNPFKYSNRLVNPYEGYRYSGIELFERVVPGTKNMIWSIPVSFLGPPPKMEGEKYWFGTINRSFNAGDIYLTCRLDGPKTQDKSVVFAVRAMLERSKRASNPAIGVNPLKAVAVFDDAPLKEFDDNRVFNLTSSVNYWVYDPNVSQPPDAPSILNKDDYVAGFIAMTNETVNYNDLNTGLMIPAHDLCVILDRRAGIRTNQSELEALLSVYPERQQGQAAILLATFGYNGDEGSTGNYIFNEGPGGGPLFNLVNGAVFTSIESLNAVTMFSGTNTRPVSQGKIIDFIEIGGTGAIGHSFEPLSSAVIDNLYLFYNILADEDEDGKADLTFIEAAFTSVPFLSWSEVVIGDPLMRIAYGPGQRAWTYLKGDSDADGMVSYLDLFTVRKYLWGELGSNNQASFDKYNDLCDVDQDGIITYFDMFNARQHLWEEAPWRTGP